MIARIFVPQTIGLLLLGALLTACANPFAPALRGIPFDPPQPAPQFALKNHDGQLTRLSDLRGAPVMVYFGWTNCKKACPLTMNLWKRVAAALQSDADNVRFVFISVDPKRDTPQVLKAYLASYDPRFVGLLGSLDEIDDVLQNYMAFAKEDAIADDEISVVQTSLTYVVGKRGQLALAFRTNAAVDDVVSDLRYLLQQP